MAADAVLTVLKTLALYATSVALAFVLGILFVAVG